MLDQRHVKVGAEGIAQNVAAGLTEGEALRRDKSAEVVEHRTQAWLREVLHVALGIAGDVRVRLSAEPTEVINLRTAVTDAGVVGGDQCRGRAAARIAALVVGAKRRPALQQRDAGPLPSAEYFVHQSVAF